MALSARTWSTGLVLVVASGCACGAQTVKPGLETPVDAAGIRDACVLPDANGIFTRPCYVNEDCVGQQVPYAPSGTLFSVCILGTCQAAQRCVEGIEGSESYCVCGSERLDPTPPGLHFGCTGATPLCMRLDGTSEVRCVAAACQ